MAGYILWKKYMKSKLKLIIKRCCVCNKKIKKNNYCSTCQRKKFPIKYAYQTLKDNAKRRGKEFTISLEDFEDFCIKTNYIAKKGIYKDTFHIDRIKEQEGYTKENIQTLTNSENVRKYLKYYWDEYNRKMKFTFKTNKHEHSTGGYENNGCPF